MANKDKHQQRWFIARVSKYIVKNSNSDLFNPPIKIESEQHARAIYLTQTKGHTYNEVI